jgi:hypothetical protein
MNKTARSHSTIAFMVASLAFAGCSTSRMALPSSLSKDAKSMPVQKTYKFWIFGLKQVDFGGYRVTGYRTGWQQGNTTKIEAGKLGYDADKSAQKFEFKLASSQGKIWSARCAEAASKRTVSTKLLGGLSADLERQATLDCTFQPPDQDAVPWTLALSLQTNGKGLLTEEMLGGELTDGTRKYHVQGISEMEGLAVSSGEPTGFAIKDEAKVLSAVQIINQQRVWMDPASESELGPPLALATSALLLQTGLLKQLDSKK